MDYRIEDKFDSNEDLYRAVLPRDVFNKENGTISSAAFKTSRGCSVERSYDRNETEIIEFMKKFFKGAFIVTVKVDECEKVDAYVIYKPSQRSNYHSEIWKSEDTVLLTKSQAKKLANCAKMVYYPY